MSAHDQIHDVREALNAGASGYILKSDGPETLLAALRTVARGDQYLAPALAARLAAYRSSRPPTDVLAVLSEREREVFRLAAECLPARDIARELCIARKTADTHLNRIHRKLGSRNLAELVSMAARLGMSHTGLTRHQVSGMPQPVMSSGAPGLGSTLVDPPPGVVLGPIMGRSKEQA
jgi:DNA-binding NarL/FixJ family response regulator